MSGMPDAGSRPRFSIVTAVYDVEPYLAAFIESVERQRIDPADLEVVAVDDGSTDGSLAILETWATTSRYAVKVLSKSNGGQGTARNLGLEHATGEWVTFPDPDDQLDRDYLAAAARFIEAHPAIEAMTGRPVLHDDRADTFSFGHPRRWQFEHGNRVANLEEEPNVFFAVTPGSFFRLDRIRAADLAFDTRIRPNFEDAHFAARYVLALPQPAIGLLRDAIYVYRKRAAGTSTLQGSMRHPGRYTDVVELGYLDLLARGRREDGSVAPWIQQLVVYEMSWFLSEDERISASVRLPDDLVPRFHGLFDRVLRELDPAVVAAHRVRYLEPHWRDILAHANRGTSWRSPYVVSERRDRAMRLRRVHYRFTGDAPAESFRAGGAVVEPAFQKTMAHRYFNRDLMFERILWLPDRPGLEVDIDGVPVQMLDTWPLKRKLPRARNLRDIAWVIRHEPPGRLAYRVFRRTRRYVRRLNALAVRVAAASWPWSGRFRNAWVVMDRIHNADDNGERLFEYLRAERRDINAFFVLERGQPDWSRLKASVGGRLIAHGSFTWKMLMLNGRWLVSSHADLAVAQPPAIMRIRKKPRWRFAFLQHGVTKDDLSRWLNGRDLDLFVVSTVAELESVAGDGTAYRFTSREARNTGLPRFDRLKRLGDAVPPDRRDLVIVAPTWRHWLAQPVGKDSQKRSVKGDFWDSDYLRSWLGILRDPAIAAAAERRGLRIGFMPHPNLAAILGELELPPHVEELSYDGTDVQALYGRCALLVTDYSSVAFNAAYLDRPVVYFQFDRQQMFAGEHVGRKGYFEYERDGFGPVVEDLDGAVAAIVAAIDAGPTAAPEYLARVATTFPERDGRCCERAVAAIEELSRPWAAPPA